MTFKSVDELLTDARAGLQRLSATEALAETSRGALLVDIRPQWQRRDTGEIPGSWIVERNHLEWRLHPGAEQPIPVAAEGQRWIVICAQGYTSSLAAAALNSIGVQATDVDGGFEAWLQAGLPTVQGVLTSPDSVVPETALPEGAG